MKLVFAGTPDFAAAALAALHAANHEIALVLTQPDRPSGRGLQLVPSAVKRLATSLGVPVRQPATLKEPAIQAELRELAPDAMIVAAYGLIVPQTVLDIPKRGCINIHASLLPRWRGAAPIQRAILAGDPTTGVSIMQMDAGLDTGAVLLDEAIPIGADDTAQTLHDRLAELGAKLIVRALERDPTPALQDASRATYAAKLDKREAAIDWRERAELIERKVRAFNPVPGATTTYTGSPLKIWHARTHPGARRDAEPGTVVAADRDAIVVACGEGTALAATTLQRAGGKRLGAAALLAGTPIRPGERFGG